MIRCRVQVGAVIDRTDHTAVVCYPIPHGDNFWLADHPAKARGAGSRIELCVDRCCTVFAPGGIYELEFRRLSDEEA